MDRHRCHDSICLDGTRSLARHQCFWGQARRSDRRPSFRRRRSWRTCRQSWSASVADTTPGNSSRPAACSSCICSARTMSILFLAICYRVGPRHRQVHGSGNGRSATSGCPLVGGTVGWLDCRVEASLDIGDRTVFVAEVVEGKVTNFRRAAETSMIGLASPRSSTRGCNTIVTI